MGPRLLALLAMTGIACSAAVAAGAHEKRLAAAPRIPALPAKNPVHHGARCPIPPKFRTAFVRAALDTGFQLSMLVAVAQVESRFQPAERSQAAARGLARVALSEEGGA